MSMLAWENIKDNPILLADLLNKHGGARGLARQAGVTHPSILKRARKLGIEFDREENEWIYDGTYVEDDEAEEIVAVGKEEYKPKYELKEDVYIVRYGPQGMYSVSISKQDLEEALNLYCVAHLTMNQVSLRMGLTRREFYAIKTAFDITKDSMPFTPEQIDNSTSEELAEKYRTKKKQYALAKYQSNKFKDIEKRVKQMDETFFWYKELCESVNQIEPEIYFTSSEVAKFSGVKKKDNSKIYVVYNTDVHAGLKVDNYFNTYNIDIMHDRFKKLSQEILTTIPQGDIYIADLGDTVHGIIHGSVQKYSTWVLAATMEVIKAYESLFLTLVKNGYNVYFTKVNGSHESLEKAKKDRTEEENFGNFIYDTLEWKYSQFNNVNFIPKVKGLNMAIIPIFDYSTLLIHGDNNSLNNLKDADRLFKEYNVREINAGHIHHKKIEDFNGLSIYYNECFCGTDQYAGNKALSSEFGTRIVEYLPIGRGIEFLVRYI